MYDSFRPHGLQHARLPCPSTTPRACSNSCPSNWWCHSTILPSVVPFSSCLHSSPTSRSFPMSQFFTSGSNITGHSHHYICIYLTSVAPVVMSLSLLILFEYSLCFLICVAKGLLILLNFSENQLSFVVFFFYYFFYSFVYFCSNLYNLLLFFNFELSLFFF